uniref:Major facilitator superfamily (MFS) profile domain-containing protein n=1 Tax=Chromera velia CCMP2878 TaxID=1169474 RepID=A0A0G4FP75_9ALVE|mmetsp:Transcript_1070/g.2220  ORF Transcript_1070/g.2220 Transcript_1070/m.2220 type:complete len:521 (+) Transcript_1070:105-1667(+)|eukprot:Cvel_18029.t1-p1 / transcript=Cvel_18029.t1 / gene=Cvel_18029 / organism=Chromera_velia_CCMP2878 / gene_product=Nitrate transporter, putative / transcript_product=Nitrate transporter, putative / location=Cvel_scaffold1471:41364-43358(+) / protein_length=520 / sequence_SO=supercontig / SO=protein_coding / is_pseudo=false
MAAKLGLCGKPPVDDAGKALSIRLFNFSSPNMKNFHWAWYGFHIGFFAWYSIAGLSSYIKKEFPLSDAEYAESVMLSVASTIVMRFAFGPICDKFGPRLSMSMILIFGSIPVALFYFVRGCVSCLYALRFAIGFLGATFVPCQFYTSQFFAPSVVGAANAFSGGWGNAGAGVTIIVMPYLLHAFTSGGMADSEALNYVFLIPAAATFLSGIAIYFLSDDCPQGAWKNRALPGETSEQAAERCRLRDEAAQEGAEEAKEKVPFSQSPLAKSLYDVVKNANTACLAFQYMASFGVEMILNQFMVLYFLASFKDADGNPPIDPKIGGVLVGILALLNLFSRATGGIISDYLNKYLSMSGRIMVHFCALILEGAFMLVFVAMPDIWSAYAVAIVFSFFAQAANGTCYSIVPSVSPYKGMISGLVGAGGNLGVIVFAVIFKAFGDNMRMAFQVISLFCFAAAALCLVLRVNGQWIVPNAATREAVAAEKAKQAPAKKTSVALESQQTMGQSAVVAGIEPEPAPVN